MPGLSNPLTDELSSLLDHDCLHASVQTALVTGCGVLVQDALLDALVQERDGAAVLNGDGLRVCGGERLAHGAEAAAHLALVGAVHDGLASCLTGALKRGYVVCHESVSSFRWESLARRSDHALRSLQNLIVSKFPAKINERSFERSFEEQSFEMAATLLGGIFVACERISGRYPDGLSQAW